MNKAVTSHGIKEYKAVTKKLGSLSHDGPIKKEDPPSRRRRNRPAGKEILLADLVSPRAGELLGFPLTPLPQSSLSLSLRRGSTIVSSKIMNPESREAPQRATVPSLSERLEEFRGSILTISKVHLGDVSGILRSLTEPNRLKSRYGINQKKLESKNYSIKVKDQDIEKVAIFGQHEC